MQYIIDRNGTWCVMATSLPVKKILDIAHEHTGNPVMYIQQYAREEGYILEPSLIEKVMEEANGIIGLKQAA